MTTMSKEEIIKGIRSGELKYVRTDYEVLGDTINVDMIFQNVTEIPFIDITYTIKDVRDERRKNYS